MTAASAMKSMWAIPKELSRTPLSVLKEQASALTEQTDGLLRGDVKFVKDGESSVIVMHVVAPALDNYRVTILRYYQPLNLFPGTFSSEYADSTLDILGADFRGNLTESSEIKNMDDFENRLRELLSSKRMLALLSGLLSQSQAATQY